MYSFFKKYALYGTDDACDGVENLDLDKCNVAGQLNTNAFMFRPIFLITSLLLISDLTSFLGLFVEKTDAGRHRTCGCRVDARYERHLNQLHEQDILTKCSIGELR
jgi:hypothetical protein